MFEEADLIYRNSRAQAVEDGVLIDVSAVAHEAGITCPVALMRAAWGRCVTVPPGVNTRTNRTGCGTCMLPDED